MEERGREERGDGREDRGEEGGDGTDGSLHLLEFSKVGAYALRSLNYVVPKIVTLLNRV